MTDLAALYPNDPPRVEKEPPAAPGSAQAQLYPHGQPKDAKPAPAGKADTEATLYPNEKSAAAVFGETEATSFFGGEALKAVSDGDRERAAALSDAGKSLLADMKAAGTPSGDFSEALTVIRSQDYGTQTEEGRARLANEAMTALRAELGDSLTSDLDKARAFIAHLEQRAPGTIASLEATGAGNDPRLIRLAIREAKRRGF